LTVTTEIHPERPSFRALLVSHVGVYGPDSLCMTPINQSSEAAPAIVLVGRFSPRHRRMSLPPF
jgi:hypothetical protein